jgi:hypothetical protein
MKTKHGFFTSSECRESGRRYPKETLHSCEFCFGLLGVDYGLIKTVLWAVGPHLREFSALADEKD